MRKDGWKMEAEIKVSGDTGEARIPFSPTDSIITDRAVYRVDLLCRVKSEPETIEEGVGYIEGDLYYVYRGDYIEGYCDEPGIYKKEDGSLVIVEPRNAEELEEFTYTDKIVVGDILSIAAISASGLDDIQYDTYDCGKIFAPPIEMKDDILKRAIKTALLLKKVPIDERRDRFPDKNSLFNAKQVIKGKQKLSAMLFDRWCEALGLSYTITLDEVGLDKPVGTPLEEPIVIKSTDTFQS